VAQGIDLVVAQNRYLPMADSAVKSAPGGGAARLDVYDDRQFAAALRARGVQYFAACNLFFDPQTLAHHPDALAVDAAGRTAEQVDWYVAICPAHEDYFGEKLRQIETAVREVPVDGLFLGFTRFPGFWEMWLPQTSRDAWPEYCFCPRCTALFGESTGLEIPREALPSQGAWIRAHAYAEFVRWKMDLIQERVRRIREMVQAIHPALPLMLSILPFGAEDFGGAGREVFGQDWTRLQEVVDLFEVMAYHQILARDLPWISGITREVKDAVHRPVLVTVQATPLYLDGMHAGRGRARTLPVEEFEGAAAAARDGGADGIIVFTWSDLLHQTLVQHDGRYVDALRRVTRSAPP
jgi:hypothetical protein